MDFDNLKNQVANISLYDIKAGFRKAQNAVMNYTEMEAKVREATNNEPWGASTTLMQEIANGTFNYATLNEIMPLIYKRFTEKAAEEWRQIYKALQLLEFLIKNGSERVIDDARSHLSLLKMLKQFHYIDSNGKDQGINVRNRAKELGDLLSDVDRIRAERKKARTTRNKYGGVEGGAGLGSGLSTGTSSGSRYGGYGSETAGSSGAGYGQYNGGVYGDGGGFGGNTSEYAESTARRERFEEYDEYDEGTASSVSRRKADPPTASKKRTPAKPEPPKPKEPEVDLLSIGDDPIPASNGKQAAAPDGFGLIESSAGEDDFDDFQSATPTASTGTTSHAGASFVPPTALYTAPNPAVSTTSTPSFLSSIASPPPSNTSQGVNYSAFGLPQPQAQTQTPISPTFQQRPQAATSSGPNYFGSIPVAQGGSTQQSIGGTASNTLKPTSTTQSKSSTADPFASLAIGGLGSKKPVSSSQKLTMADMAKQRTSANIWGAPATSSSQPASNGRSGGDDLLG